MPSSGQIERSRATPPASEAGIARGPQAAGPPRPAGPLPVAACSVLTQCDISHRLRFGATQRRRHGTEIGAPAACQVVWRADLSVLEHGLALVVIGDGCEPRCCCGPQARERTMYQSGDGKRGCRAGRHAATCATLVRRGTRIPHNRTRRHVDRRLAGAAAVQDASQERMREHASLQTGVVINPFQRDARPARKTHQRRGLIKPSGGRRSPRTLKRTGCRAKAPGV